MALKSKQQNEPSKEETELRAKIADLFLAQGFKLVKNDERQRQCLCVEENGELSTKLELRKNSITGHLQIMAFNNDSAKDAKALLTKNKIGFTDSGASLNIITPWQSELFRGLKFPSNLTLNVQNFGPVKIIPGSVVTLPKEKENRIGFNLSVNLTEIAWVAACPEERFVDQVEVNRDKSELVRAVCEDYEFPFKEFVQRTLSRSNQSKWAEELVSIKRKELSEFAEALRKSPNKRSDWKKMTDPNNHNPTSYIYIVHSLSRNNYANFESDEAKQEYLRMYDGRDPLGKPDLFVKRSGISCSLIGKGIPGVADHTATWGDAGFILSVPPENIRTAHPSDTMPIIKKNSPEDYDSNLPSPEDVLRHTSSSLWNEVFVAGVNENTGSAIQIIGSFLYVAEETGQPLNPYWTPEITKFSKDRNLPIVKIRGPKYKPRPHLGD